MRVAGLQANLAGGTSKKAEGAPEGPKMRGAVHSADLEYAFGTLPTNRVFDWQPEDFTVSEQFTGYFINFIRTGNPNGPGLVEWPAADNSAAPAVLLLDVESKVENSAELEKHYTDIDEIVCGK